MASVPTSDRAPKSGSFQPFGVVEAVNGNLKTLFRRGRGYKNWRYLLLKAQGMAALKAEFLVMRKAA